jgi:hypothetical protein
VQLGNCGPQALRGLGQRLLDAGERRRVAGLGGAVEVLAGDNTACSNGVASTRPPARGTWYIISGEQDCRDAQMISAHGVDVEL